MSIKQSYDEAKSILYAVAPFFASLLAKARVVASKNFGTAGVTPSGVIVIDPDFWLKQDQRTRVFILTHEVSHIAFRDLKRKGNRNMFIWNLVADAVNNHIIRELVPVPYKAVTFYTLDSLAKQIFASEGLTISDIENMSKEELYSLFEKYSDVVEVNLRGSGLFLSGDVSKDEKLGDYEVLQEGDPSIYRNGKECEDAEEKWKDAISSAYNAQKIAGDIPVGLRRFIDEILRGKINWRALLHRYVSEGVASSFIETWKRQGRKNPLLPDRKAFTIPTVWMLIDTSGSMSKEEVAQGIGEVCNAARLSKVKVIFWDANAYDIITVKSRGDVENLVSKVKGGGGTVIRKALEKVLYNMKYKDVVVVFSDFEIFDFNKEETQMLFRMVASKASVAVAATVHKIVEIPKWRTVRVR